MVLQSPTFAQLGNTFDKVTDQLIGGIDALNKDAIAHELRFIQSGLNDLLAKHPEQFNAVSAIHAQNIADQINLELTAINSVGQDTFAPKYINDVQRDIIDIVQNDAALKDLATHHGSVGFEAVPQLLVPPTPFQGNAEQTQFMQNFVTTTQDFASRALTLAEHPDAAQAAQLASDIQSFEQAANTFTTAQGGLYSARFNNEFAAEGVNGTASKALIAALGQNDAVKINAAAEVLTANAADVSGNMLGAGQTAPAAGSGIPDSITTLASAGTVFNDATAKLIGGVYDGNRISIHNDLVATEQGIQNVLADPNAALSKHATADLTKIVALLKLEDTAVQNAQPGSLEALQIHALQTHILSIVNHDPALSALAHADGAPGFMALPKTAPAALAANQHGWSNDHTLDPHNAGSDHGAHMLMTAHV